MWPFTKKKTAEEMAWEGPWAVLQGERDGLALFASVNQGAEAMIGDPRFGYRVNVGVPLTRPREDGLPVNDEAQELWAIEDALVPVVQAQRRAIFVATATTSGVKEFIFYTGDEAATRQAVETVAAKIKTHKLQLCIEPDAEWSAFGQFFANADCT